MLTAYLCLTAAMAIVGSSVVAGKLIVDAFPVMFAGGMTSALATSILFPLLLLRERGLPSVRRSDLGIVFVQAFTGSFLWRITLLYGLSLTTAAESGIITSTTPAAIGVLSILFLGERLSRNTAAGIALAVLGILAINAIGATDGQRGPNPLLGNLLIFGSVLGEAAFTICGKAVSDRLTPLTVSTLVSTFSFLLFLPFGVYDAATLDFAGVSVGDWAWIAYFGIVLNVCAFILWFVGVSRVPASTAAVFTGVLPVSALALSYVVLGEPFFWSHLIGAACVLLGIALIAKAKPAPDRGMVLSRAESSETEERRGEDGR
jgi:drug/metabolite transporter (DMT)-like permease